MPALDFAYPKGFLAPAALALLVAAAGLCVALCRADLRERRLPNALVAALWACFGLLCLALSPDLAAFGASLAWGLGTLVVLTGVELAWRRVSGGSHGVGLGDVKLLGAFALMLHGYVLVQVGLACILALVANLPRGRRTFAFGPYLCLAGWCLLVVFLAELV